jgi:hypothetical protein
MLVSEVNLLEQVTGCEWRMIHLEDPRVDWEEL